MTNLVKKLLEICLTILTKPVKSEHVVSFHGHLIDNFMKTVLHFY